MSRNHARIGSAWRTDFARRMRAQFGNGPVLCMYVGYLPGACKGPIERHHPVELADGGQPTHTAPACRRHHQMMSSRNKAARGQPIRSTGPAAGRTTPSAGARPALASPPRTGGARLMRAGALLLLAAVAAGVYVENTRAVIGALLLLGAPLLWGAHARATGAHRRAETARVRALAARALNTDPALIGAPDRQMRPPLARTRARRAPVARWGWEGALKARPLAGTITYPLAVNDREGSDERARVEEAFGQKLGAHVVWMPQVDAFDWWVSPVDDDADPVPAADRLPASGHPSVVDPGSAEALPEPAPVVPLVADPEIIDELTEDLRLSLKVRPNLPLAVEMDVDGVGPTEIRVKYPPGLRDDQPDVRMVLQDRIHAQTGLRFAPFWDTLSGHKTVTLSRRPELPAVIPMPLPEPGEELDPFVIPLGVDEHLVEVTWNLRAQPHGIVSGATGSGKSFFLAMIVYQFLIRGYDLILIDGKGTTFAPFRLWEWVVGCGLANDPAAVAYWMLASEAEAARRYDEVIDHKVRVESFSRLAVIVDELTEANRAVIEWWKKERVEQDSKMREHPAPEATWSTARKGREAGEVLLVANQQANASAVSFGSTEARLNLPFRLALGPTDRDSAIMMFGRSDLGRDVPDTLKGRGTIKGDDKFNPGIEIQTYYVPRPQPSGDVDPQDQPFFDALFEVIRVNRAGRPPVRVADPGDLDVTPDPRLRDYADEEGAGTSRRRPAAPAIEGTRRGAPAPAGDFITLDELAAAVHQVGRARVVFDGDVDPVVVVAVDESQVEGVIADVTFEAPNGSGLQVDAVTDSNIRFRRLPM